MLIPNLLAALALTSVGDTVSIARPAMGVRFEITLAGVDEVQALELTTPCFEEADRLEALLGIWSPDSALQRLNADQAPAGPRRVPPELARALEAALAFCERSGGAFDPSIGAVLDAIGYYTQEGRSLPTGAGLNALRARVGCGRVAVAWPEDGGAPIVTRAAEGVLLDLSGVAKGWVVDRLVERLRAAGAESGLVSAGPSAIRGFGPGPEGKGWAVEVAGDAGEDITWWLRDQAIATSGQRSFTVDLEGEAQSHIVDPRLLAPIEHDTRSTVARASTCAEADMLSTALLVMGAREAETWLRGLGDAATGYRVLATQGTRDSRRTLELLGDGP